MAVCWVLWHSAEAAVDNTMLRLLIIFQQLDRLDEWIIIKFEIENHDHSFLKNPRLKNFCQNDACS